jgi:hypothetical protein
MPTQPIDFKAEAANHAWHVDAITKLNSRVPRLKTGVLDDHQTQVCADLNKAISIAPTDETWTLGERYIQAMQAVEPYVDDLFRPEAIAPKVPVGPKDPLTKEPLTELPTSQTERALLATRYPDWLKFMEKYEKNKTALSIEMAEEQAAYENRRDFQAALASGKFDGDGNPFMNGGDLSKAAEIAKNDPVLAGFLREEARARPFVEARDCESSSPPGMRRAIRARSCWLKET